MQGFTIVAIARRYDGKAQPFTGRVEAPYADPRRGYVCAYQSSLFGGGTIHSPYPEWAYAKACAFIREDIESRHTVLLDAKGGLVEFAAPAADEYGIGCFPEARFRGLLHRQDGDVESFTAAARPPLRDSEAGSEGRRLWRSIVKCSVLGMDELIASDWPEHAYALAFEVLRLWLDRFGRYTDRKGGVLSLGAPVKG